jgi:hypothetical protein
MIFSWNDSEEKVLARIGTRAILFALEQILNV